MKIKTHSGAKKRFKVRAKGKMVMQKSCKRHLLSNKSKRQKESFKGGTPISKGNEKVLRKLLSI
ncbi:MAG: 50S ribosomal protein L35 [Patescibacteria group bacterium]